MFQDHSRDQLRLTYCRVWQRLRAGQPLKPLEAQIAEVIVAHPEYQPLLEDQDDASGRDFDIGLGATNPFLHMGMHLALGEQVATDRPAGIAALHRQLCIQHGDRQAAEHAMMECLGEALWSAQRHATAPDETRYMGCLRRLSATKTR